ncbi:MAG: hypothetical protein LBU34_04400 [Planctomycetaceae bacterium]|nr:hypothetical protein [Planctomycetaceae bacterium]
MMPDNPYIYSINHKCVIVEHRFGFLIRQSKGRQSFAEQLRWFRMW